MLQNAEEDHIVNISSINSFWASVGLRIPHTACTAAKFAIKGFTEALITDLRINAPHIKSSVAIDMSVRRQGGTIEQLPLAIGEANFRAPGPDLATAWKPFSHN